MSRLPTRLVAIVGATAAAGFAGAQIAGAAGTGTTTTTPPSPSQGQQRGPGETPLTDNTKTKVEQAALAKVPGGTVIRSETDQGGTYEAHVRKSDGTEVEVKVDASFDVTAVETRPAGGRGHGGPGGRGFGADLTAIAKALGVTEAKLQSAVQAARPQGRPGQRGDDFAAAIAKALGASTADVQSVLQANRGGGRGHHGDDSALVSALAKKLSVTEAKAQAAVDAAEKAHEADHQAREDALYAAVAKALGKDPAAVKKAFEDNRPQRP